MRIQIWRTENIENILWATQTVIQATAVVSEGDERPVGYHRGFSRGFETGLQHIAASFDIELFALKIWSHEYIKNILLAVQAETPIIVSALKSKKRSAEYKQGFNQGLEAALWCVATSFGLDLWSRENASLSEKTLILASEPDPLFQRDIQSILFAIRAVMQATIAASQNTVWPVRYNQGFEQALQVVAQLLGLRLLQSASTSSSMQTFPFWLRRDIEKKLLVAYQKMPTSATVSGGMAQAMVYRQGFEAALRCLATSFGIKL